MRTHYVPELITICAWMMIGSVTIWLKAQIVTNHHPGTLRSMAGGCLLHICAKLNDTSVASTFGIHEVSGLLASRNVFQNRNKSLARRRCAGERVEWVPRKLRCFTRAARHSVCLWLQLLAAKTCHYCSFRRCLNQGSAVSLSYAVLGGIKMTFWCLNSGFRTLPGELFKVLEHQKIGHLVYLARLRCSDYFIGRYQRKAETLWKIG